MPLELELELELEPEPVVPVTAVRPYASAADTTLRRARTAPTVAVRAAASIVASRRSVSSTTRPAGTIERPSASCHPSHTDAGISCRRDMPITTRRSRLDRQTATSAGSGRTAPLQRRVARSKRGPR